MKLYELKDILSYDVDLGDDEIDCSFYMDLSEIPTKWAKQIEVVKIHRDLITCKFTEFLDGHRTAVLKYLRDNYYNGETRNHLINTLVVSGDITCDGGEAVYHFLTNDLTDFFAQNMEGEQK